MKRAAVLLLAALVLVSCAAVYAAGGTSSDPLISIDYLNTTYLPEVVEKAAQAVASKTQTTYQAVLSGLDARQKAYLGEGGASGALADQRYKRGDVISLTPGSGVLLLAGGASVSYGAGGAVVDVTAGQTVASGSALTARHHYLAGEYTTASVTVTTDTAVLSAEGLFTLSPSAEPDYNALADALKAMGLFRGSDTGYGSGYNLELTPTRVEGLVMFLRLIGEEDAALSYTGADPFADTPEWCRRYTAYAYAKGYTKGVGASATGQLYFGTGNTMTAGEYMTFVLRALGYTDSGSAPDFSWANAVGKSLEFGAINSAEHTLLTGKPFLRAQVVYVSYFALSAPMKSGGTLLSGLTASGALDGAAVQSVMNGVNVPRLS